MRVALAALHAQPHFTPLALLYIKAFLVEREGFPLDRVSVLEFRLASTADEVAERILATGPDIVALSCYVWNITTFMAACERIKTRRPSTLIVLGGPEVGPRGDAVLASHPAIDIVVKSEGEIPFAAITRAIRTGTPATEVAGLWCRSGGNIADTGEAVILQDLDTLPSPHQPEYGDFTGRNVCIETQRGCVFRCNFCFYNKDYSIRNRRFDLDRVKQEILFWLARDVREIYLMDPIFNLKAARAKDLCRFIVEHNPRRVPFHAEVWAEFIDDELAGLMREANFEFLEVGLQTTDETALAAVERRLKMKPFLEGIRHLKRHGLSFELQLIYGLPGETPESFRRSLNFAASLDPPLLAVFLLMVLPGTELWRKAGAIGLEYDPAPPYFVRSHPQMSADDIAYGKRIVEALGLLGDAKTLRLLGREPGVTYADVVDEWTSWDTGQASLADRAQRFITHFCAKKRIPPAFYSGFAAREFS